MTIHNFSFSISHIYSTISRYASVLYEDSSVNRMHEDVDLFATTLNAGPFMHTPIYLIFNKKDLFESMLRKKPLTTCFPEYTGSSGTFYYFLVSLVFLFIHFFFVGVH